MTATWGEYVIQEELGRGSFGTVVRALHPTLRQPVALKLIPVVDGSSREIERALDESRRLASVHHHNVVTVHDARYLDGRVGICMELVRGESLSQLVERRGRLGPDEVQVSAITLCNALSAIHAAHIVHNDVKAQNVVREDGGRLVLMDFGAGRRLAEPDRTTGLYLVGTPVYMAPEIFRFQEPTPVSDIYSLGVLLFFLLTALYPVQGHTLEEIAQAHARGRRRYLGDLRADIPERLLAVIDRALEPQPSDRYQSCGEMLHDLTAHGRQPMPQHREGASEPIRQPQPVPNPIADGRSARERLVLTAGVLAIAVPIVWIIGFLGYNAHRMMFGVQREFDLATPLDWLVDGLRTLPLPIFSMLAALTLYLVAAFAWRVTTRVSVMAETWSSRTSRRVLSARDRVGLDDPAMAAALVLLAQLVLLGGVYWLFWDLIAAITTPLVDGPVVAHASLDPAHEDWGWLPFCMITSILALGSAAAWTALARRRQPGQSGAAASAAGFALTAVFFAMATVPRQLVYDAAFNPVTFQNEHCYVIEDAVPERALLLCPWREAGRSVIVETNQLGLVHREVENVYAAVAARLHAAGGL